MKILLVPFHISAFKPWTFVPLASSFYNSSICLWKACKCSSWNFAFFSGSEPLMWISGRQMPFLDAMNSKNNDCFCNLLERFMNFETIIICFQNIFEFRSFVFVWPIRRFTPIPQKRNFDPKRAAFFFVFVWPIRNALRIPDSVAFVFYYRCSS